LPSRTLFCILLQVIPFPRIYFLQKLSLDLRQSRLIRPLSSVQHQGFHSLISLCRSPKPKTVVVSLLVSGLMDSRLNCWIFDNPPVRSAETTAPKRDDATTAPRTASFIKPETFDDWVVYLEAVHCLVIVKVIQGRLRRTSSSHRLNVKMECCRSRSFRPQRLVMEYLLQGKAMHGPWFLANLREILRQSSFLDKLVMRETVRPHCALNMAMAAEPRLGIHKSNIPRSPITAYSVSSISHECYFRHYSCSRRRLLQVNWWMINHSSSLSQGIPLSRVNGSNVLQVGESVTVKWHPEEVLYPTITLVLWDPTPDGVFYDLGTTLDEIKNTGSANWLIANFGSGQYHLGIGVGICS
jgi:hypothetical protein